MWRTLDKADHVRSWIGLLVIAPLALVYAVVRLVLGGWSPDAVTMVVVAIVLGAACLYNVRHDDVDEPPT